MFTTSDEKLVPECTYGSVNKRGENMTKLTPVRVPQDSPEPLRDIEDNYCNLRTVKQAIHPVQMRNKAQPFLKNQISGDVKPRFASYDNFNIAANEGVNFPHPNAIISEGQAPSL